VENLDRLFHGVTKIEIVLDAADGGFSAELIAHQKRGKKMIAAGRAPDIHAAIDAVIEKMDHQMRKKKEIVKERRKKGAKGASPMTGEEIEGGGKETSEVDEEAE
jgi:ribosomal subunit interface protein